MKKLHLGTWLSRGLPMLTLILMLLWLAVSLRELDSGRRDAGREQLENSLRCSAAACYAVEGIYPPSAEYLEEHYGVQIDRTRYTVFYESIAENLMPDITVLVKHDET